MPLVIKDDETEALVHRLAKCLGLTSQAVVKRAVAAALDQTGEIEPLHTRLQRLCTAHPLPPATSSAANKAFFDEISDDRYRL